MCGLSTAAGFRSGLCMGSIHPSILIFSAVVVGGLKLFKQPFPGSFPGFSPPHPLRGMILEKWKAGSLCGNRQKLWSGKGKILETFVENPESCRIRAENCQKAEWVNCGQGDADRRCALLSFSHRFQQSVEKLVETQFLPRSRMFLMRVSTSSFKELSFWMDWEMLLTAYTMVE